MKPFIRKIAGVLVGTCVAGLLAAAPARAGDVAVVANEGLPLDRLSAAEVKRIFLGEKSFVGDVKVHPFDYAQAGPASKVFFPGALNLNPEAFESFWLKEVFRSGRIPPGKVDNVGQMLEKIASDRGAIGFVPVESVQGVKGIKSVLTVPAP
jgi:hypothetical protein